MEKEISKIYSEAQSDIIKKWNAYMERGEKRLDTLYNAYIQDSTKEAKEAYEEALKNYTLQNDSYKAMIDATTTKLANANTIALAYVNDQLPEVYTKNWAQVGDTLDEIGIGFMGVKGTGIRKLVNEDTIKQMIQKGDVTTPFMKTPKYLSIPKDKRWNTKQINSSVLQGILQGESIPKISKRLLPIVDKNESAAVRNARTLVTGAQNSGRLDSYKRLAEEGVVQRKVWMATPDGRTRDWHLEMDGQEVEIDELFDDGLDGLMYPGDSGGAPESVYNCRCTMHTHIIGFRKADGTIEYVKDTPDSGDELHDERIVEEKQNRLKRTMSTVAVVNGTDISETWARRSDQFDFEIQDVINAQGFDGIPRVVSAEEFDKAVQESNFIAQRTYSAPDQETLDMYRDQLYHGEWYVDCSTGGAQYGQGMYCAADYKGKLTDGIKAEMTHYQELGERRNLQNIEQQRYEYALIQAEQKGYNLNNASIIIKKEMLGEGDFSDVLSAMKTVDYDSLMKDVISDARQYMPKALSYTETLTLDPSAKIINYSDLEREFNSWKLDAGARAQREIIKSYKGKGEDFVRVLQYNSVDGGIRFVDAQEAYNRLLDDDKKLADEVITKMNEAWRNADVKVADTDIGTYAASKGYDAINAEGHGESGSYTVILNRTKVIFKGE